MNGLDLYNFVYDTFVRPQHPFASRDVRTMNEPEPQAADATDDTESGTYGCFGISDHSRTASTSSVWADRTPSGSLIVLADRRRCKEST